MEKSEVQVSKEHYFKQYDDTKRFISYYYQIDSVLKTKPEKVLEIGIGNKTVSDYLKKIKIDVTTCDFAKDLEPDVLADVRNLPFKDNSFDTVMICEVLEHLPFEDFEKALSELHRVTKNKVILSIPYSCAYFEMIVNVSIPFFRKLIPFSVRLPYFFRKIEINEKNQEHYWEMGRKNYSKRKIRGILKKYFNLEKEFQPILNSYHYFFQLNKKKD